MTGEGEPQTRDGFSGKRGFILSSIGSAVGMANIWRFPAMVSLWGGLTFIIPYLIFVVLITATGVIGEFTLGRAAKAGPCGAFGMCTEHRFGNRRIGERIGLIPVVGSLALAIGYTCVVAWIIKYTFMAFDGELFAMGQDMDAIAGMFNDTAGAWGANAWVIIAAVATMLIMSLGVSKGIEKANNVLMPLLFAGMASIVNLYETPVSFLQERFGTNRVQATVSMVVLGGIAALCIQSVVSPWMDGVSIYICPLGALLAAIMLFWVAGKDFAESNVNEGAKKPIGRWFVPMGKYAYCALSLVALVAGALLGGIG